MTVPAAGNSLHSWAALALVKAQRKAFLCCLNHESVPGYAPCQCQVMLPSSLPFRQTEGERHKSSTHLCSGETLQPPPDCTCTVLHALHLQGCLPAPPCIYR